MDSTSPRTGDHDIRTWSLTTPAEAARWTDFAAAMAVVRHPALARVVEVSSDDGTATLVCAAEPGQPVHVWAAQTGASVPEILAVVRACAAALDAVHAGSGAVPGVGHGAVRTENVIVRADGSTAVVGFTPWITTTDRFTAPELRAGSTPTPAGDAFALARLTAEVLLGTSADAPEDDEQLVRLLRADPRTRRRPRLVAAIRDVLAGPPETRPRGLQAWLGRATEGAVTGGHVFTPEPVSSPPTPAGRRRLLAVTGALTCVAVIVGLAVTMRMDTRDHSNAGASGGRASATAPLRIAASWYPRATCFGGRANGGTAVAASGMSIDRWRSEPDAALAPDGGRWGTGIAKISLTAARGQIIRVRKTELVAVGLDAPNWVLMPERVACFPPRDSAAHYILDLDDPTDLSIAGANPGQPSTPAFTVSSSRAETLAVEASACDTNREWRLRFTYYVVGDADRTYYAVSPPLRLFGATERRTRMFAGTQARPLRATRTPHPAGCVL